MSIQRSINKLVGSISALSIAKNNLITSVAKNNLIAKQEMAAEQVRQIQEAKKTQRRNFMEYLSKMPTSLGGTVGELPKDVQKTIASTYSKSERRAMMDRMDKEHGKK